MNLTIPASPMPEQLRNRTAERLNFALCCIFIVGYLTTAAIFTFGPDRLHESDSMMLVRGLGIPWPAWGAIYLSIAALLSARGFTIMLPTLTRRHRRIALHLQCCFVATRTIGYFAGGSFAAFYFVSYLVSISHGHPGSIVGLLAGYIAIFSQLSGGVRSIIVEEWR